MGCFSGHLMSSASDQKLFCEICSAFNYSFDEFVGEKVVSPSYSSAILAPPQKCMYNFKYLPMIESLISIIILGENGNDEISCAYVTISSSKTLKLTLNSAYKIDKTSRTLH